jgi:hypothetical protein
MYSTQLKSCPLFLNLDDEIITRLALKLNVYLAAEGDQVVAEGEVGDEMYMVVKGGVRIISKALPKMDGKTWVDGAFFGEVRQPAPRFQPPQPANLPRVASCRCSGSATASRPISTSTPRRRWRSQT